MILFSVESKVSVTGNYVLKVSISPVKLILSINDLSTFSLSFSSSCGHDIRHLHHQKKPKNYPLMIC